MGKAIYKGLRPPDDPIYGQTLIVIGGVTKRTAKRRSKRSDKKEKQDSEPSQAAKSENSNIEETNDGTLN